MCAADNFTQKDAFLRARLRLVIAELDVLGAGD